MIPIPPPVPPRDRRRIVLCKFLYIYYSIAMIDITTYEEFLAQIKKNRAALFYCSTPSCGVCKSLKPKVIGLVKDNFPRLPMFYVDTELVSEVRGQLSVYSVPAVLVYFEGKELIREARNFGIMELGGKIDRYYSLLFDEPFPVKDTELPIG